MDIYDAPTVGYSIDSKLRSNLSIGLPIDLMVLRRDSCDPELIQRIEPGEPYFSNLHGRWSVALRAAHVGIPRPTRARAKSRTTAGRFRPKPSLYRLLTMAVESAAVARRP